MTWKYGTILRDDNYGRTVMVTREIPKAIAGESDLFEAIDLDNGQWVALSPVRDKDLTEIMDPNDPAVITLPGGFGTITGFSIDGKTYPVGDGASVTFDPAPAKGEEITVSWKADGTFEVT